MKVPYIVAVWSEWTKIFWFRGWNICEFPGMPCLTKSELVLWPAGCCCLSRLSCSSLSLCSCGLVHQTCVCRGVARRWKAAQRVFLFLTAPPRQATPTGSEGRSRPILAPPTRTLWFSRLDAVSSCGSCKNISAGNFWPSFLHGVALVYLGPPLIQPMSKWRQC